MASLKLLGLMVPEEYGGAGLDSVSAAIALEEIARVDGAVALIVASHNSLCTGHLYAFGSEEQRRRYVVPLAKGEVLGAWALTEPGSGSDAAALSTRAELKGGEWVLNGSKMFTTQGSTAGVYVIMAATDPSAGSHGISAFVV
jgi:alkylation response protein AidB-like acyl-CoA dehydrogenase